MRHSILILSIRHEHDIVLVRQRTAQLAEQLQFTRQDQVRLATAVSEIARNAFQYAGGGKAEFVIRGNHFQIEISDRGPGIPNLREVLDGQYKSSSGMGLGIVGAQRLLPLFEIRSARDEGTSVILGKELPPQVPVNETMLEALREKVVGLAPQTALEEVQNQNHDLLLALEELENKRAQLRQLNRELEETNRGVVALYAELDEKAEYLRRASDLKTRFLSNMTHEFRTPLNSILSLCRILLDRLDGDLTTEQEKQVRFIQKAADDLSALVNDLLDLAKVEAGKVVVKAVPFEVEDLFASLRGTLRPLLAHNKSIELVIEEPRSVPALHTDETKVGQILRNLISNALKFTDRGEVRVSARKEGEQQVTFAVSDTGCGIAPEHQERIFEEFVQLEGAPHSQFKGTGLGLPITKRLAELLGGKISLQSQPGAGSTFEVTIPITYGGATGNHAGGLSFVPDPLRYQVVIYDEDPDSWSVYEKLFKATSLQAVPVRTIGDARNVLMESSPIATILCLGKDNEKEWSFLRELKTRPGASVMQVFVVADEEQRSRAYAMGANEVFALPFAGKVILAKLREVIAEAPRLRVLLVDDDETTRYLLRELFRETKFLSAEARDGREALARAKEVKPDAVILDLSMPVMDGFAVVEQFRANEEWRNVPIVIHTAKDLTEAEKSFFSRNRVAVLTKEKSAQEGAKENVRSALEKALTAVNERK